MAQVSNQGGNAGQDTRSAEVDDPNRRRDLGEKRTSGLGEDQVHGVPAIGQPAGELEHRPLGTTVAACIWEVRMASRPDRSDDDEVIEPHPRCLRASGTSIFPTTFVGRTPLYSTNIFPPNSSLKRAMSFFS